MTEHFCIDCKHYYSNLLEDPCLSCSAREGFQNWEKSDDPERKNIKLQKINEIKMSLKNSK